MQENDIVLDNYDNIISLGYNCETALRYKKLYENFNSSLFNWAFICSIKDLFHALQNLDKICTGNLIKPSPLWKCENTNIYFHGRLPSGLWTLKLNVNENLIKADENELRSRINYLKQKFINTLNQKDSKNLCIYKMHPEEFQDIERCKGYILDLYDRLKSISNCDLELLIIIEKNNNLNNLRESINNKKIFIDAVEKFAPNDNVSSEKFGKEDWIRICNKYKTTKLSTILVNT